jgi:hypothetical protein
MMPASSWEGGGVPVQNPQTTAALGAEAGAGTRLVGG